jgi:hypothetical protein
MVSDYTKDSLLTSLVIEKVVGRRYPIPLRKEFN